MRTQTERGRPEYDKGNGHCVVIPMVALKTEGDQRGRADNKNDRRSSSEQLQPVREGPSGADTVGGPLEWHIRLIHGKTERPEDSGFKIRRDSGFKIQDSGFRIHLDSLFTIHHSLFTIHLYLFPTNLI